MAYEYKRIKTKDDFKEFIAADRKAQPSQWGVFDPIFKLKTLLRRCEYHRNNKSNIYHFLMFVILRYRFRKLQRKMCSEIGFNVFGKGLIIWHGQRIITNGEARVGDYCSISSGVVIGHGNGGARGWCRFVGLVVDSITTNHATRPSSRRRSMMLMPNSVLIRLSRYQTM